MLKSVGILFIVCVASSQAQIPYLDLIQRILNSFGFTQLNGLTSNFNNLRDEIYGHFFRSQNQLRSAGDQLFSAGQRFPYFSVSDQSRDAISQGISALLETCSKPTTDFLGRQSTLPLFNYPANSTSPIENAFKPVSEIIKQLDEAVGQVVDTSCLRALNINVGRLQQLFGGVTNAINGCIRTLSANFRSSINDFTQTHFQALPQIQRLFNDLQACSQSSINNRESCAIRIGKAACATSDSVCTICTNLKKVLEVATGMMVEGKGVFDTCLSSTPTKVSADAQKILDSVRACSVTRVMKDQENEVDDGSVTETTSVYDSPEYTTYGNYDFIEVF